MLKKFYVLFLFLLVALFGYRFYQLRYVEHDTYFSKYLSYSYKTVSGLSAPRGRILDRNGKVLVDNYGEEAIVFRFIDGVSIEEVLNCLLNALEFVEEASIEEQVSYFFSTHNVYVLLNKEEKEAYAKRKMSREEAESILKKRIEESLEYDSLMKKKIHLYTLLNSGYIYDNKIIKEGASNQECALISEANLPGLSCEMYTKRVYLYDTMNALYGTVGSISKEQKEEYLSKGYSLDDQVGLSYLEKEYDSYLRGEEALYSVLEDGSLELIRESASGSDLVLSISIDLQMQINEIIKKNLELASTLRNTDYYNTSYVLVSDPTTGEILASTGISKANGSFRDVTSNLLTQSFTVGSVIKGASHTVGYQNNVIEVGAKIKDACVKLYQNPTKCSYKRLGFIDDVTALKTSSNYYQFINAIKLTGNIYSYNMKLPVNESHFNLYRDTFSLFGLGSSTGIDLENESLGIRGKTVAPDLLLNLSIGQYDTYTPLQLLNYINTIATSGNRYALHYLKSVEKNEQSIYYYEPKLLNSISDNWYFSRIIEGFKEVLYTGTGRGYTDLKYKPAGKTGTSEVVYGKGITTINQTYAMFAPYDNPKYSIVVISPNISYNNNRDTYIAPINRYISKEVSALVFETLP